MKATIDIVDIKAQTGLIKDTYRNYSLTGVNDHVIKISVMTESYFWHYHPNSDEVFLVTEGILIIDLEGRSIELQEGQLFTVPKNLPHRTRPKGLRSVNLTFEYADMATIKCDDLY